MAATVAPLRSSTSWSAYQPAGLTYQELSSSSDRRYVFDSGGRPNGTPGSGLMSTTGPGKPSSRSVAAALPPARPSPMITIGFLVGRPATRYILPRELVTCDVPMAHT